MQSLAQRAAALSVPRGQVAVFWLGQAGFLLKTADGTLAAIDPYLSDCCQRYFGFKRLMPRMLETDDLTLDMLLISHAHYDHFDVDAVPALLAGGRTRLYTALDGRAECERLHLEGEHITYLQAGDMAADGGIEIRAVPCDHGELAPDALGFLLSAGGKTIYFTGDTAYRPDLFENPAVKGTDLLIAPINGAFGNMDEAQAAQAAAILRPGRVVPCHFWNFAEHGGDPGRFMEEMKRTAPDIPYTLMPMGGLLMV